MKKLSLILAISISGYAFSQNIVSAAYHSGGLSAATQSVDYRWSTGGSPRSGIYHYWRQFLDQSLSASGTIPLNGIATPISVIGTTYSPVFSAQATGKTTFANSPTSCDFTCDVSTGDSFQPNLSIHQGASISANASDYFTFTIDKPSYVSLSLTGNGGALNLIDSLANESIFGASSAGSFADTLDPGTYAVRLSTGVASAQNRQTGLSQLLGINSLAAHVELHITGGAPQ